MFLVAPPSNVVGQTVTASMNVQGCKRVDAAAILERGAALKSVAYAGNPTTVTIYANELGSQYVAPPA